MTGNHDQFDENLRRMLKSALGQPRPAFQERLVREVLAEVCRQREAEASQTRGATTATKTRDPKEITPAGLEGTVTALWRWLVQTAEGIRAPRPLVLAGGAVVVVLLATTFCLTLGPVQSSVGQIKCLYGLVAVEDNGASQSVAETANLRSGQRIQTRAGSSAEILLADKSKLFSSPRTSLQIARSSRGPRILLEQGTLQLEAAKQSPGKAIRIEAASAHLKVLGTRLEVRLVEKPSGARQTRVRVWSGQVEMESGGQKVLLLPGTEGVAEGGQPPVRSSVVFEVNELLSLFRQAARSGRAHGPPAIFDLTTETLWTVVPAQRLRSVEPSAFILKLKYPAFRVRAYTLDGVEIPATGNGKVLRLDFSAVPGLKLPAQIIVKVPGVGGLLREAGAGLTEFSLPGSESDSSTLLQLLMPESSRLDQVIPAALGTREERNRLILEVSARVRLPEVCE